MVGFKGFRGFGVGFWGFVGLKGFRVLGLLHSSASSDVSPQAAISHLRLVQAGSLRLLDMGRRLRGILWLALRRE